MILLKVPSFKNQASKPKRGRGLVMSGSGHHQEVERTIQAVLCVVIVTLAFLADVRGQNLIPNPDFNEPGNPLQGWRLDFPYEQPYAKNVGYVKISADKKQGSANVAEVTLPKAVAENEGGKIESAFVKAEPGATYRASVDCMTGDFSAKVYVEAYALDPTPPGQPDKFRVPAREGMPALVMVYRKQFPDPPATSKVWTTDKAEFKLPEKILVAGKPSSVAFVAFKVFVYSATTATVPDGKADFTRFQLTASK